MCYNQQTFEDFPRIDTEGASVPCTIQFSNANQYLRKTWNMVDILQGNTFEAPRINVKIVGLQNPMVSPILQYPSYFGYTVNNPYNIPLATFETILSLKKLSGQR